MKSTRVSPFVSAFDGLKATEVLPLLVEQIAQLPLTLKKVLAMYYYENLRLAEIAACLNLTECETDQIRAEAVDWLHHYFARVSTGVLPLTP